MSHFLLRWRFTDQSAKALVSKPQDRTRTAETLVEGFGGKLHDYYFTLGDYDGLAICEFPDTTSAAACAMSAASTGAFSKFDTTPLLTAKEAEAAMRRAYEANVGYTPPNT
ncbi:MAG: GYD domain-containing protein [Pseudomonadota bacterium]|nr:GYD domain-containing protein [Pseudomonadota bacterium]